MFLKKLVILGIGSLAISFQAWSLEIVGIAPYKELGSELFLGALYLEYPVGDPAGVMDNQMARRLELRFLNDLSKRRWVNLWMQSIAINNNQSTLAQAANELVELFAQFKDGPHTGDVVRFEYRPDQGTSVHMDDIVLRDKLSADAFNLFVSAWVGPVPPSTDFRNQILGVSQQPSIAERFHAIGPAKERIDAVAAWLVPEEEPKKAKPAVAKAPAKKPEKPKPPAEKAVVQKETAKPDEAQKVAATPAAETESAAAARPSTPEPEQQVALATSETAAPGESGKPVTDADAEPEAEERTAELLSIESILANQKYATDVIKRVYQKIRYPKSAIRKNQQGSVRVRVNIVRDGELSELVIEEECEHNALNREAQRAIESAAPFPELPDAIVGEAVSLTIPISFRLSQ